MKMMRRDFLKLSAAALAEAKAIPSVAMESVATGEGAAPQPLSDSGREPGRPSSPARWIWAPGLDGFEPNTFIYFRRGFDLDAVPSDETPVKISASTEYHLYVNGNYIGFGPPITDPRRRYFDVHDISRHLRKGRNVIAVQVYSLATATEDTIKERGRFLFEATADSGRDRVALDSDSRWKCFRSQVWLQDAPRQSHTLHYAEIADLRKEPTGWNGLEFDDSKWLTPAAVVSPEAEGSVVVQRELGEIREAFRPIAAVVRLAEVERKSGFAVPALEVQNEKFIPVETVKFANISSLQTKAPAAVVSTPADGRDAAIVFDMGRMVLGCPFFEAEGAAGTLIDVSISEYLKDGRVFASRSMGPVWGDTPLTNLTDRITLRQGAATWKRNDYNGYRYMQFTIRNAKQPLTLRRVGTVQREYDFRKEAEFRSSNSILDRIFNGCKWSHRVNTHWGYCGSAWREHAQWSDLAWPAMNMVIFQDAPAMRYYLRQIALGQRPDGSMIFPHPGSLTTKTELPEQTMWLADCLWKCALYFDDRELVQALVPAMVKTNEWFRKHLVSPGVLSTKDWSNMWIIIDWGYPFANISNPGELATLNLIYYNFLCCTGKCAGYLGNKKLEADLRKQSEDLKKAINRTFWMSQPGLYAEKPNRQFPSAFANTLAVKYGVAPKQHAQTVLDSAMGIELRPGKASPWFMYSALEALAEAGRFQDAVTSICRYWGTFLDIDSSVFWELWNIPGQDVYPLRGSNPEGVARTITYSTGPAAYAVNHILGVQPLEPRFRKALIAPHPSGLESFEGKVPTPFGYVHLAWRHHAAEQNTECYVSVPEGIRAEVRLPYSASEPNVTVDGQWFFRHSEFSSNLRITNPAATAGSLNFEIAPGYYYFRSSAS